MPGLNAARSDIIVAGLAVAYLLSIAVRADVAALALRRHALAAPHGAMMLSGCFGLVRGVREITGAPH